MHKQDTERRIGENMNLVEAALFPSVISPSLVLFVVVNDDDGVFN